MLRPKPQWLMRHTWEIALIAIAACAAVFVRGAAEQSNLTNLMAQAAPILLLAVGQTFVLIVRGIDLTQGALVGLSSVALVFFMNAVGPLPAIALTLCVAGTGGLAIGFLITRARIDPLIGTLAAMFVLSGATMYRTGGTPLTTLSAGTASFFRFLGTTAFGVVPTSFVVAIAGAVGGHLVLRKLMVGLRLYAVGSNPAAAASLGIQKDRLVAFAYCCSALFTVFAALLMTARIRQGNPHLGEGLLFESIGAAVLGGVSMAGGVGGVWPAARGVLMLTLIQNVLYLTDLNSHLRDIAVGALIVVGVVLARRSRPGEES